MALDPTFDRSTGIGASEAAAVLGLDPYRTPLDVWLVKTGRREPFAGNHFTDLGNRLEPIVADLYAERFAVTLEATGSHRERSGLPIFASPDRLVSGLPVAVECKAHLSPSIWPEYGDDGSTTIPVKYRVQDAVQAAVCDLERVDHAALVRGELRVYRMVRDHAYEADLMGRLTEWWATYVDKDVPPPPDGTTAYGDWLKGRYPAPSKALIVAATEDDAALLHNLEVARAMRDRFDAAFEKLKQEAQARIGDAAGMESVSVKALWSSVKGKSSVDWEAVARSMSPSDETIAAFTRTASPSRRFTVTTKD